MELQSGYQLSVAPHFHLDIPWADRLRICPGTEKQDENYYPRLPWREPSPEEVRMLVGGDRERSSPINPNDSCCFFQLPQHMVMRCWEMLEQDKSFGQGRTLEGFDEFAKEVSNFLDFKETPVPSQASIDLVASKPGQKSIYWQIGIDHPKGLDFNLVPEAPWPLTDKTPARKLWGGINLGLEAFTLILCNLRPELIEAELSERSRGKCEITSFGELGRQFFLTRPDYPLIKLSIETGEGFRLPKDGILFDGGTEENEGPLLLLLVR